MIKTFSVGGRVDEYQDYVYLAEKANSFVHTLQCNGWEILDIDRINDILPFDIDRWDRREYAAYIIRCRRPDNIDYNTLLKEEKENGIL